MTIIYGRWDVISFHKNLAKPWAWLILRRNAKSDHFLDKVYRSHLRPSSFFVRNAKDDHKVQLGIATKVVILVLRNAKTTFVLNCTRSNEIFFRCIAILHFIAQVAHDGFESLNEWSIVISIYVLFQIISN